jgi:hypothetical protein
MFDPNDLTWCVSLEPWHAPAHCAVRPRIEHPLAWLSRLRLLEGPG